MEDVLIKSFKIMQLQINNSYFKNLLLYWEYLLQKNQYINLISRIGEIEVRFISHIIDSLTGLLFDWPKELNYLDLGSGGGLPGLPLKICNPGWSATLVESKAKKANFLAEVSQALGLSHVSVRNSYLDPRSSWPGPVNDLVTTRGLASLKESLPLIAPALKAGGRYLAYKGPKGNDELEEAKQILKKHSMQLIELKELTLPIVNLPRSLFLFQKT